MFSFTFYDTLRRMTQKKIKIYSLPECPGCIMAKQWLKENNFTYQELDVEQNLEARREMMEKTGQLGVPVIEIDEQILVGFNPEELAAELNN